MGNNVLHSTRLDPTNTVKVTGLFNATAVMYVVKLNTCTYLMYVECRIRLNM